MAKRVGFTLIVVCQFCNQKNRAFYHLLRKTNCGKCHTSLLQPDRPQGVVYLLKSGQYYKIGRAKDLNRRLRQIKLQLPFETTVIHSIEAFHPDKAEIHWHRRFADKRKGGEWFELSEDVAEFKRCHQM